MNPSRPPDGRRLDGPIRRLSLAPIEPTAKAIPASGFTYRRRTAPIRTKRRWGRWIAIAIVSLVVLAGLYIGVKTLLAASRMITSGGKGAPALDGSIDPSKLNGAGDGRVNILLLGIGGDGHDGGNLSDTIMVMSIDPQTKDVAMLSIPRDLYVKIPGYGYGKINSANAQGGPALAEKVVSKVLDIPIHYYMQVDFSGFKQAVDAVGGVDINVPTALRDPAYPCETGYKYCPYYQPAGQIHMSGLSALRYARCRHGNCGDDIGRAARQQVVIAALRVKALSIGTLTNPLKLGGLIDALGGHVKTDLQLNDMKKLAVIAKDVDPTKIVNKVPQFSGPDAILTTITNNAGDVLVPKAGEFDYSDLQNLAHSIFVDHYITTENAAIQIQNGSGVTGLAGKIVTSMKATHYNLMDPVTAAQNYKQTYIYDYSNGKKPYTVNYLQQLFGVKAQKGSLTPTPAASQPADSTGQKPDIVIILGSDYASTVNTTPNR